MVTALKQVYENEKPIIVTDCHHIGILEDPKGSFDEEQYLIDNGS